MKAVGRERLGVARLLMVLSSLAPLFMLMGIRGNSIIPEVIFAGVCAGLAAVPTLYLLWRIRTAYKTKDVRDMMTGRVEDHRNHVLIYLFATLLPFYREDIASCRDLAAMGVALAFIVFLFWRLNLHYMNLFFALFGFQIFTVDPPEDTNPKSGKEGFILITRRKQLSTNERVAAYRLSNTVYLETGRCVSRSISAGW